MHIDSIRYLNGCLAALDVRSDKPDNIANLKPANNARPKSLDLPVAWNPGWLTYCLSPKSYTQPPRLSLACTCLSHAQRAKTTCTTLLPSILILLLGFRSARHTTPLPSRTLPPGLGHLSDVQPIRLGWDVHSMLPCCHGPYPC